VCCLVCAARRVAARYTPLCIIAGMPFLTALRWLALVEGVSTLVLFGIAMPLKYFAGMPAAVSSVGLIHGVLFSVLALMFLLAIRIVPMSPALAAAGIVAAVFPGGPFLFDRRLARLEPAARQAV
jgi:integral membrane protein